jgi:nicotinamide-nucleotide amidase
MKAEIITIGDEILIGQIVDTNSAWLGQELNKIGITVTQISSISDSKNDIIKALGLAESRADVILITGGLGPTKDDITKHTLATYFNSELVLNEEALENVKGIFARFNRPVLEVNVQQAYVPHNCIVIQNKQGTAPAMYFEKDGKHIVSMPGVPFEMKAIMEQFVLPILSKITGDQVLHETILTAGIGESFLAQQIEDIESSLPPHIKLAYLPKLSQVRLRLSAIYPNHAGSAELQHFKKLIIERIHKHVVAEEDITMEEAIIRLLKSSNSSLSTAESCTGGYLGHLLTSVPGSSEVYHGGAISYSYDLKKAMLGVSGSTLEQYGAVSKETVEEMVTGALKAYNSDYSIACSGIAGPGGGTVDKPVGTVWIAVASKDMVYSKKFIFGKERAQNIERTAIQALYLLLRLIRKEITKE